MNPSQCPRCDEYVNGARCQNCSLNVETATVVTCDDCGTECLKADTETKMRQAFRFHTVRLCSECQ